MKNILLKNSAMIISFLALAGVETIAATEDYKPTEQSLEKHQPAPEWLKDAKLGIYFHWGVYTIPAFGTEWYPHRMHIPNNAMYEHHVKTYGTPDKFGYHQFVPMFTGEHFDAEE